MDLNSLREWWVASSGDPVILFMLRMTTASFAALAAVLAWQNVIRPNEWERTWANGSYRRLRVLNCMRALALSGAVAYFVGAGALEWERTSTPNRLIVANAVFLCLFTWNALDQLFWRDHFRRKRVLLSRMGIKPERT